MKKYKIVQKDDVLTLYERNDYFVTGLKLLPLTIILFPGIGLSNDWVSFIFFMSSVIVGGFNISMLVTMPYSLKETFYDEIKLHDYIAEQKMLDKKPKVYYLD